MRNLIGIFYLVEVENIVHFGKCAFFTNYGDILKFN